MPVPCRSTNPPFASRNYDVLIQKAMDVITPSGVEQTVVLDPLSPPVLVVGVSVP